MTDSEINIAIAKDQGWPDVWFDGTGWAGHKNGGVSWLEDYADDLHAIAQAVKGLSDEEYLKFIECLFLRLEAENTMPITDIKAMRLGVEATARQRAEAYLRVKGLWEENK